MTVSWCKRNYAFNIHLLKSNIRLHGNKRFSKKKGLRAHRGMSQEYLEDEARVGLRTIQRIENNESKPTGGTIKRLSAALGTDLKELLSPHSLTETND